MNSTGYYTFLTNIIPTTKLDMELYYINSKFSEVKNKFSFLPRRCAYSGNNLFFKKGIRVSQHFLGHDESGSECRWYDPAQFIAIKLQG